VGHLCSTDLLVPILLGPFLLELMTKWSPIGRRLRSGGRSTGGWARTGAGNAGRLTVIWVSRQLLIACPTTSDGRRAGWTDGLAKVNGT
jgi:hypothetical protein